MPYRGIIELPVLLAQIAPVAVQMTAEQMANDQTVQLVCNAPCHNDLTGRERSGLLHAIETLREIPEIGFCFFDTSDVVRHALLEKIILAYRQKPEAGGGRSA